MRTRSSHDGDRRPIASASGVRDLGDAIIRRDKSIFGQCPAIPCRAGSDRRLCPAVAWARYRLFAPLPLLVFAASQYTEARGVLSGSHYNALSREPAFQEFADGRCAARQAMSKPPIIQCADFLRAQHDLQPVRSREI